MRSGNGRRVWKVLGLSAAGFLVLTQGYLLIQTILISLREGLNGPFVGLANWRHVLTNPLTWALTRDSLRFSGWLLAMIPMCLCAAAGLLMVRSPRLRMLSWGLYLLPLALGQTELTLAIRWLMGPILEQGKYLRIPMAYATMLYDLPFFLLVVILMDELWRPGLLRTWGFLAVMGGFWALYRGFNAPYFIQRTAGLGSDSAAWTQTLGFASPQGAFLYDVDRVANAHTAITFLPQIFTLAILVPMAWLATRMVGRWARVAAQGKSMPRMLGLLALPALLFALLPVGIYISRLPSAVTLGRFAFIPPTLLNILGSLLALAAALPLSYFLTLPGRRATRYAVWGCVLCGVSLMLTFYLLMRGVLFPYVQLYTDALIPLLSAVPLFAVALIIALGLRMGVHRSRGFAGLGLLSIACGLSASHLFEWIFSSRANPSVPLNQFLCRIYAIMGSGGLPGFEPYAPDVPVAPFYALFMLALIAGGVALMASALPKREA